MATPPAGGDRRGCSTGPLRRIFSGPVRDRARVGLCGWGGACGTEPGWAGRTGQVWPSQLGKARGDDYVKHISAEEEFRIEVHRLVPEYKEKIRQNNEKGL